jgi:ubiquilin
MLTDPGFINQMLDSNPFLKQLADSNPMLKQLVSDPELMKQMMNPESISAAMQMMGGGSGGFPGMPPMGMPGGFPGMPGMPPMGGLGFPPMGGMMGMNPMMMGMMGANPFGPRPGVPASHDSSKPPKERFAEEIQIFKSMGIADEDIIVKALVDSNGNVEEAMMSLMSHFKDDYGNEEGDQPKK